MRSNPAYIPLRDLDNPQLDPPRIARRKGLWIILALAVVIALTLAVPFYDGPAHNIITDWATKFKPKDVRSSLKNADIIPKVIDDFTPTFILSISWSKKHDIKASLGNSLEPKDLQDTPEAYVTQFPSSVLHNDNNNKAGNAAASLPINNLVLVATDPDAPSRRDNKWSEFCHWIALGVPFVNASASFSPEAQRAKLAKPLKALVDYRPPGPPPKTGKHRYVFLALSPKNGTSDPLDLIAPSGRQNWGTGVPGAGIKGWADDMGLVPIAANYIYAKNPEQ